MGDAVVAPNVGDAAGANGLAVGALWTGEPRVRRLLGGYANAESLRLDKPSATVVTTVPWRGGNAAAASSAKGDVAAAATAS